MSLKNEVLLALLQDDSVVSSGKLAQELNIRPNDVRTAVRHLRKDGHDIERVVAKGYRLRQEAAVLSQAGILRWLRTVQIGRGMEIHESIESTNSRGKVLAGQGKEHGFLIAASTQTHGRGRMGRDFFSPDGSGIYISFILWPRMSVDRAMMITSMAAVAVARAIEALVDTDVKIKWVNDLYINDKKVCGILSEASMDFETGQLEYVVLGIGVNVGKMAFPEELQTIATSIFNETGVLVPRNRLIAEIANQLEPLYMSLETAEFMDEYRSRSNVIGRKVMVLRGLEHFEATAMDIDDRGRLVVQTEDGTECIGSGEISLRVKGVHY